MLPSSTLRKWLLLYHAFSNKPAAFWQYLKANNNLNYLPQRFNKNMYQVELDMGWLNNTTSAHILTWLDKDYPLYLRHIKYPPPVLYALGDISLLQKPQIAVVGSRIATPIGLQHAKHFSKQLCRAGFVVTSGLALGIDTASHEGALSIGATIAVLAHGLDTIYPKSNAELANKIVMQGCLISEFGIGVIPLSGNFPRRNRIISGLSMGVLVIEATLKSGSLITARYAIDQGREVFAIPGGIHLPKSQGCNYLIKQGAKLVENLDDVLLEFETLLNCSFRDKYAGDPQKPYWVGDVLQSLQLQDHDVICVDKIMAQTGLASETIYSVLDALDLQDVVFLLPLSVRKSD